MVRSEPEKGLVFLIQPVTQENKETWLLGNSYTLWLSQTMNHLGCGPVHVTNAILCNAGTTAERDQRRCRGFGLENGWYSRTLQVGMWGQKDSLVLWLFLCASLLERTGF